jgi:UrcA family protein
MNARTQRGSARSRLSLAIAASLTALVAIPAVHAEEARQSASVPVHYSAREASTDLGAQRLYRRLQAASRTVCEPYQSRDLVKLSLYNTCYQHALADAVANVNLAALRDLHNEHNAVRVAKASNVAKPAG